VTITALPNIVGAVNAQLRSFNEITTLVGSNPPRISAELKREWVMPTHAILLRRVGGPGGDYWIQTQDTRIDVRCYGSTGYEAARLWQIVHAVLCPNPAASGRSVSFRKAHCIVYNVTQESSPISLIEPETNWPFTSVPYIFKWSEVPLA
jgi:hypothetical protein